MACFSDKTLLVLGDSIMYGSGNDGYGVGEYLRDMCGFKLEKYCYGGARVGFMQDKDWIVEQVRRAIGDGVKPDYIVFDGFTNDCNQTDGVTADVPLGDIAQGCENFDIFAVQRQGSTFSNCFENILHALKKYFAGAKLLFIRPHKMGRRDSKLQVTYGERAVELCKKWGVAVVDLYNDCDLDTFDANDRDAYTNDSYGWGRGDCTHPNAAGYTKKYMPLILAGLERL